MKKEDKIFLTHILAAIKKLEEYLAGVDYDDFIEDSMRCDAVVRELEIIGEGTKSLSKEIRKKYSQIPWKQIAGMRDKLTHEYFGVDLHIVWQTCKEDIVELKRELMKMMK